MPFQDHMPAMPEGPIRGGLRASPAWALLVLVAGLLFTVEMARREWIDAHARDEALQHALADAAQARVHEGWQGIITKAAFGSLTY